MIISQNMILPAHTIQGRGKVSVLTSLPHQFPGQGLVVHSRSFTRKPVYSDLHRELSPRAEFYTYENGEPGLRPLSQIVSHIRKNNIAWVAGIGGGSVLDVAKAAAGLAHVEKELAYYQTGALPEHEGIPFIAVPTTAGSGAEATPNAVIINEENQEKKSIRHPSFMARLIILDPDLLIGIPPQTIAFSGMDAITQGIESFTSRGSFWLTEQLALKGLTLLFENIEKAYLQSKTTLQKYDNSYENMLIGSYLIGIAFSNSRLGVVHGIAHPLGSYYNLPHGQVCALCLNPALSINKEHITDKYAKLSEIVGIDLQTRISSLLSSLNIENVFKGKEIIRKEDIIEYTLSSGSAKANPKTITRNDIELMLNELF